MGGVPISIIVVSGQYYKKKREAALAFDSNQIRVVQEGGGIQPGFNV